MKSLLLILFLLTTIASKAQQTGETALWAGLGLATNPFYHDLADAHRGYFPGIRLQSDLPQLPLRATIQYNVGNLDPFVPGDPSEYSFLSVALLRNFNVFKVNSFGIDFGLGGSVINIMNGRSIQSTFTAGQAGNSYLPLFNSNLVFTAKLNFRFGYYLSKRQRISTDLDIDYLFKKFVVNQGSRAIAILSLNYEYGF